MQSYDTLQEKTRAYDKDVWTKKLLFSKAETFILQRFHKLSPEKSFCFSKMINISQTSGRNWTMKPVLPSKIGTTILQSCCKMNQRKAFVVQIVKQTFVSWKQKRVNESR